jgi:Fe2+ transport system protein FeoA
MTLDMLAPGRGGRITKVNGEGPIRLRLLDMGLTPKTEVLVHKVAPMGDPMELHLRGYSLSIRLEEAQNIEIEESRA